MKKTYITTMPDHIGSFLQASRCFAELGMNITRVSYNKAVDINTLFIDAEGTWLQHAEADRRLKQIGYLQEEKADKSVVLLEFCLPDLPGSTTGVLELINAYAFNISYISYQESSEEYQLFKLGLFVENPREIARFLSEAEQLCRVRVLDYNCSEKVLDNSVFYDSFVSGLTKTLNLSQGVREALLVNANLAMQNLDERGLSPFKTFESIRRFADVLAACRGKGFEARITYHPITDRTKVILIEPPCGSNTAIVESEGAYLFVDTGYALYEQEMIVIFRSLIPNYDTMRKTALVTHPDQDHCGLLHLFDQVITGEKSAQCLLMEYENETGFREENYLHKPYIQICKILTAYNPPAPDIVTVQWDSVECGDAPIGYAGTFDFGDLHFEVYEGKGGHVAGSIVLIDREHKLAFTGDIYINVKGLTAKQAEHNQYAPILMTSVDTDAKLCAEERKAVLQLLGSGQWQIFGGHGCKKEYDAG